MYLEKAKPEEFEAYYQIKCEPFVNFWSRGEDEVPPRENLYRFYQNCTQSADCVQPAKEIYLIKTDEGEIAGYLYMEDSGGRVDLPIAVSGRFSGRGLGRQAIRKGLMIAKERGYRRSVVEIREDNAASIRMYTACGYRRGEKTREMYAPASGRQIALYAYHREIADAVPEGNKEYGAGRQCTGSVIADAEPAGNKEYGAGRQCTGSVIADAKTDGKHRGAGLHGKTG